MAVVTASYARHTRRLIHHQKAFMPLMRAAGNRLCFFVYWRARTSNYHAHYVDFALPGFKSRSRHSIIFSGG